MSGSFGNYAENKILEHIVGKTAFTKPTAYIALSTADPGEDNAGLAEPSGNGYARVATAAADWNNAASGSISNAQDITFPQASGSWGTIAYFAIMDAAEGGNMLAHGSLGVAKAVSQGDTCKYAGGTPGDLVINLD
ncbi:MAG: hypothetical protein AMQ22_00078 [Candidatus Methanofastidiosum methylothiophilum]|uniref:Uncharacterized protein n=1 Tax=Candidatus Methanofastidiosum methylothiophilum TaxID=1705564 RepID=A0A150J9X4_9EURY|nr:MAG: hypothetical protein AMQ22_00078 [Candidatus Methanofastidiosum methylthiophilus]